MQSSLLTPEGRKLADDALLELSKIQVVLTTIDKSTPFNQSPAIAKSNSDRELLQNQLKLIEPNVVQALAKRDIQMQICAALKNLSDDSLELSKQIIPVLVTLALTGVIQLPAVPLYIACAALLLGRMGVAAICAGSSGKER